MAATVFYLDEVPGPDGLAVLEGATGRHAATVRRIGVGERITLSDGAGVLAPAVVETVGKDRLELKVLTRALLPPPTPTVTVVQALPKAERSELAVELAAEAGADVIVPWQAARCVARWAGPKAVKGVQKWSAAAYSAAQQARRAYIPQVTALLDTAGVVELVRSVTAAGGVAAALHESATHRFAELSLATAPEVVLIVGPEGGIDERELELLSAAGAASVVLGPTVLRTSTAAAVALGALGVLTGRWEAKPPL